ncbi:MAG TPA: hypothetical protein VIY48_13605, partial [Candidatus Paceibacterota bacterium]
IMKLNIHGEIKELAIGDMTKEQLDWVIRNAQIQANADAATIVMQHDYSMTPTEQEQDKLL